eukprot:scaffold207449_cov16-Tisochrysis_lutea.AAC.2
MGTPSGITTAAAAFTSAAHSTDALNTTTVAAIAAGAANIHATARAMVAAIAANVEGAALLALLLLAFCVGQRDFQEYLQKSTRRKGRQR